MEKIVVKTAVKTVLIILAALLAVFAVFNFGFPQHMATAMEGIGNYDLAVKYASLRYRYTKDCGDLARCFDDSVLLENDKYILEYGEKLIENKDYADVCREKDEQQKGSRYDYDHWVKSKLSISYYNTGNAAKAIDTAVVNEKKDGVLHFEYGNALMSLAARIRTDRDAEAAGYLLEALEEVVPADSIEEKNLEEVKIAMRNVKNGGGSVAGSQP